MLLTEVFRSIFKGPSEADIHPTFVADSTPTVLNVGGGNKQIEIPGHYRSWRHVLLDIDPSGDADIVMDARTLNLLPAGQFDAVYCSHNLEHYFKHDVAHVLSGFLHVLKPGGFAEIHVPNMRGVMKRFIETGMDIEDTLYTVPSGPITVLDVVYGLGSQIENTGVDFYAHKTGFTQKSLMATLNRSGFPHVWLSETTDTFGIGAVAFKQHPTPAQLALLDLGTVP